MSIVILGSEQPAQNLSSHWGRSAAVINADQTANLRHDQWSVSLNGIVHHCWVSLPPIPRLFSFLTTLKQTTWLNRTSRNSVFVFSASANAPRTKTGLDGVFSILSIFSKWTYPVDWTRRLINQCGWMRPLIRAAYHWLVVKWKRRPYRLFLTLPQNKDIFNL